MTSLPSDTTPNDSSTATTTASSISSSSSNSNYQNELITARNRMKQKMKEQQLLEGNDWEEDVDGEVVEEQVKVEEIDDDVELESKQRKNNKPAEKLKNSTTTASSSNEDDDEVRNMLMNKNQPPPYTNDNFEFPPASEFTPGHYPEDPLPPPVAEPVVPPEQAGAGAGEEKTCRICFDGEDEELGNLFSPCVCRGTSRFVHVECLNRWRQRSVGANSFFRCDQCQYEYRISRSSVSGLATNKYALGIVTFVFFTLLIFLSGFLATGVLEAVQARQVRSVFDEFWVSDYQIMGETMQEAVQFFGTGIEKATGIKTNPVTSYDSPPWYSFFKVSNSSTTSNQSTLLKRTIQHFIKGFSFVGIVSFFQTMLVSSSALGIFGLRGTIFRAVRPNRRNGDNQVSLSQLVIVAVSKISFRATSFFEERRKRH